MRSLAAALSTLVLAACASSPPTHFYMLSAPSAASFTPAASTEYAIVVGPAIVPASVDRPQFVLRLSDNRVALAEEARWAEPLASAIPETIAADLAQILDSKRVLAYPETPKDFEYQVLLQVLRFDSEMGQAAAVELAWTIRRPNSDEAADGRALVREPVKANGYEALAAAHSRALRSISGDIAKMIRRQAASHDLRS